MFVNMLRKILNIIGAFGGIVFIVQAIVGLCFPEMLKWYYRRREIGLSATTEKKVYVSKAKFDREFAMYQELSSKALSLVYKIGEIVLRVKLNDKEKTYEQLLQEVTDLDNDAEFCNKKFGAFISEELFEKYKDLYKECHEFERMFGVWSVNLQTPMMIVNGVYMTGEELKAAFIEKQKVISNKSDQLLKDLRQYINSLECE